MPDNMDLVCRTYLVLLDTAHTVNRKESDVIVVACFSLGKLYFL